MYSLVGRKSHLSLENNVILCKANLRPIWTYGVELHLIQILNHPILNFCSQNAVKILLIMTDAAWFVSNHTLHNVLNVPRITDAMRNHDIQYRNRNSNKLVNDLVNQSLEESKLKRHWPEDLIR